MAGLVNEIKCGDCIEVLNGVGEPFADLVFADPPFNIGYQYDKYHDKVEKDRYLAWTRDWMAACIGVLKPHGSFYIAIGDEYAANVRLIGEELGLTLRNWIIWHYTFGQQTKTMFARSHAHIFYFVMNPKAFTFNDFAVRVPSDRQLIYNDKRADSRGKLPDDVWNTFSRVCGTFRERCAWHPCQMPEMLLGRIIAASSNPGDVVLDPFLGSATTAAAAVKLNRCFVGVELSANYASKARERIDEIIKGIEHPKSTPPSDQPALFASQPTGPLNPWEAFELQRLYVEVGINAAEVLNRPALVDLYAQQLALRMNNGRQYAPGDLVGVLKEMTTWVPQKNPKVGSVRRACAPSRP